MVQIKSKEDIAKMAEACRVAREILTALADFIKPGVSTKDIDIFVEDLIRQSGQKPAFKGYAGFPACACVSVNEEVIHGIPSKKKILAEGDIVSVDLGTIYQGFYSDTARTYPVGKISEKHQLLIRAAQDSFFEGLKYCKPGFRLGDVGSAIQQLVESRGFSVIRDYTGHGVGRDMHEDPAVLNYGKAGHGMRLAPGMVLAIEPMIATGSYDVEVLSNDWTVVMCDGGYAAHYENTVAITDGEPLVLSYPSYELL